MASDEELAEMEKLSAGYVPEQEGDLVGVRISSQRLTSEYAKADPVYANKTRNLPEAYPEYRPIKGDGNCGFRAIAFGYFEALVRIGKLTKTRAEIERLKSLNKLLDDTGQEAFMYEDWVELTLNILEQTASISSSEDNEAALLEAFNDLETANAITQHFRMITSAWMKLNPNEYAPFVPDLDVASYCSNHVDPFYEEIEHVGVKALVDSTINPAGIAVEYLYLDRSAGDAATPYSFPIFDEKGVEDKNAPTIRLLYRPGHYDLLYKKQDLIGATTQTTSTDSGISKPDSSILEVRTLHFLPDSNFPYDMSMFDGLPGFDPTAAFYIPTWYEPGCQNAIPGHQPSPDQAYNFDVLSLPQLPSSYENPEITVSPRSSPAYTSDMDTSGTTALPPKKFDRRNVQPASSPPPSPLHKSTKSPPPYLTVSPSLSPRRENNGSVQLNWIPKTHSQCSYDERLVTNPIPSSRSDSTPPPLPPLSTPLLTTSSRKTTEEKEIAKKPSHITKAPAHFKQDPLVFRPKMWDGKRVKFVE